MQVLNTLIKSAFFYPSGTHSRWKAQQSSTLQWPVCSATRCTASTPPDWAVALFSPTTGGWRELPMCWTRGRSHRSMWPLSFALRIPSNVVKVSVSMGIFRKIIIMIPIWTIFRFVEWAAHEMQTGSLSASLSSFCQTSPISVVSFTLEPRDYGFESR